MYQGIDAVEPGHAPSYNHNPYAAYYFVIFIFIGSFFFMNWIIGVLFELFNE